MSVKIIGVVTSILGISVIIVSSLILYDVIQHKNRYWEIQNLAHVKYSNNYYWDQFKYDSDILIILAPLCLLVGLVQTFLPVGFFCAKVKDFRRLMLLWIGCNLILLFFSMSCFIMGMVYGVDTVGFKTYNYQGRYSSTYLSSWWKYDKGQAFLGVLGCDNIFLFVVIILCFRWRREYTRHDPVEMAETPTPRTSTPVKGYY